MQIKKYNNRIGSNQIYSLQPKPTMKRENRIYEANTIKDNCCFHSLSCQGNAQLEYKANQKYSYDNLWKATHGKGVRLIKRNVSDQSIIKGKFLRNIFSSNKIKQSYKNCAQEKVHGKASINNQSPSIKNLLSHLSYKNKKISEHETAITSKIFESKKQETTYLTLPIDGSLHDKSLNTTANNSRNEMLWVQNLVKSSHSLIKFDGEMKKETQKKSMDCQLGTITEMQKKRSKQFYEKIKVCESLYSENEQSLEQEYSLVLSQYQLQLQ